MRRSVIAVIMIAAAAGPVAAQATDRACNVGSDAQTITRTFDDLKICVSSRAYDSSSRHRPREWVTRSKVSVLETRRPGDVRQMEVVGLEVSWWINEKPQAVDSTADIWRIALLDVVDSLWHADDLRRTVADIKAQIAGMPAQRDSLRTEITTLETQSAAWNAEILRLRSSERDLRSQVTSAEQRLRAIQDQLSRERSALSGALRSNTPEARSRAATIEANIRRLEDDERRQDDRVRGLQGTLAGLDVDRRTGRIDLALQQLNAEPRIAVLELQVRALDANRVAELQQQIVMLDLDNRLAQLDAGTQKAVARLRAILDRSRAP